MSPDTPRPGDIAVSVALLTRWPVPGADHARGARAAWAWPVAGLAVGIPAALAAALALALGLPDAASGGIALSVMALCTGGLHEDGLADCADGFWGGSDRDRRLEIMRDSRIGAFGVLALILVTGLRWSALAALASAGAAAAPLVAAAIASRGAMVPISRRLPEARPGGLSARIGRPPVAAERLALLLVVALCLLLLGWAALVALAAASIVAALWARLALSRIGGQSGDVLGGVQQVSETAFLLALTALA